MNLEILCTQVQWLAREVGRFISDERLKFTAEDIIHKGKSDMSIKLLKSASLLPCVNCYLIQGLLQKREPQSIGVKSTAG
jgi:hypothetical protein